MTPKEKAIELVIKYYEKVTGIPGEDIVNFIDFLTTDSHWKTAKECALIAVNEIGGAIDFDWMEVQNLDRQHTYWQQVRDEINNI